MSEQIQDFEMSWQCCCEEAGETFSEFERHIKRKHRRTSNDQI